MKKKYDAAKERLENDVKEITELIQVRFIAQAEHGRNQSVKKRVMGGGGREGVEFPIVEKTIKDCSKVKKKRLCKIDMNFLNKIIIITNFHAFPVFIFKIFAPGSRSLY